MKHRVQDVVLLQVAVVVYSLNTVVAKFVASAMREALDGLPESAGLLDTGLALLGSPRFLALFLAEFAVLGVYAIMWQQLIKKFELSIAYANKAMTLLWSLLWSVTLFDGQVTATKLLGIFLVIGGTIILNTGGSKEGEHE